jgi:hypothetical protein
LRVDSALFEVMASGIGPGMGWLNRLGPQPAAISVRRAMAGSVRLNLMVVARSGGSRRPN